jgi:imidazolonepropionase-like amidohydrolase
VRFLLTILASAATLLWAQESPARGTSIAHVTVVDVAGGAERRDQTVRIEAGRILSISPSQENDATQPGAVDGRGKFLIPGLYDMHVHLHEAYELSLYVANGVTGIRIMAGDRNTAALRAELARQSLAPGIYLASAIVDGSPPTWPGSIVVKKPADARRAVDDIKAGGADFIKVYTGIPRSAYFALADEARQQHIDFEGHVPDSVSAQEASAAGQRTMEHLLGIATACSSREAQLMDETHHIRLFRQRLAIEAEGYRTIDAAKCGALFAEFKQNGTWQVPTLTVRRIWGRLDDSKFISDPRLAYIGRKSRDRWQERTEPQMRRWTLAEFQLARGVFLADERMVGLMFHAGVPLMAGTDAMNPYCFPGFGLHDELALLVEAGLTPLAALQAATIKPARFLGRSDETGTVDSGKKANLVLLGADPLADIHNTTKIEAVWLDGKYFDAAALSQLLANAKEQARH